MTTVWEFRQWYESHMSMEAVIIFSILVIGSAIAIRIYYEWKDGE